MLSAQKLRNALLREASKTNMNLLMTLKASVDTGALQEHIDYLKETADKQEIPIDGIVAFS